MAIDPPAADGALAPQLAVDGDALLATWLEPHAGGHRLQLARYQTAWSKPVTIAHGDKLLANWADTPTLAIGGDRALVAAWPERTTGEGYDAIVARSTDGGATWTRLGPLHTDGTPTEHGFVSFASDPQGVRAIWLDGRATTPEGGGATALRTALVGARVAGEAVIDDRVCDCCSTAMTNAARGPVIAYRDRSADETRDIAIATAATADAPRRTVHDDRWTIAGCPVNGPAIAARGDAVAVAWFTTVDGTASVRVAFSRDGGATFTPPIEIDHATDRAPLGRVGVVLVADDEAIVSWMAARGETADILARRVSPAGAKPERVLAQTTAGRTSGFPRLARVGDQLALAWTDPTPPGRIHITRLPLAAIAR